MLRVLFIAITLSMPLLTSASETSDVPESVIFTLYANAPSDPFFRVKIATFDYYVRGFEEVDAARNQKFCSEAAELFQEKWKRETRKMASYPGVDKFRYWCEKGRFKK